MGAFELGLWLDRHGGLRATVGPTLGGAPGAEAADSAGVEVAASGHDTPRGSRTLGVLVLELQDRIHAAEREKSGLCCNTAELQAESQVLQEQVNVQAGLKSRHSGKYTRTTRTRVWNA